MKPNIFVIIAFCMSGAIMGADSDVLEKKLVFLFQALPDDLQRHIISHYFMLRNNIMDANKQRIKTYARESLEIINPDKKEFYDIQEYFAFKNMGTECTHIIAFYPKAGERYDFGIKQTKAGPVIEGASAIAFMHTLKDGNINTVDCFEKREQIHPSSTYNGIILAKKDQVSFIG